MTFAFTGTATVRHVNLRKEGATDAKNVMADIKLEAIADASILDPFNDRLVDLLFTPAGEPRIVNLAPIHLNGSIKHLACSFPQWAVDLRDVEAKKFQFEPLNGSRVTMTFSIAIEPRGQQTATLAEMLGEAVKVQIGLEADLFAEKAPNENVKALAREIIAQGPEVVEAAKAVIKARKKFTDHLDKHGGGSGDRDGAGKVIVTRKSQLKTAKVQPKTAGEMPGGKCWTAEELLFRIPPAKGGHVLVLRAIAPAREEMIELRINALDDRGQRIQVGYACAGKDTGTWTAPTICRQRGMLEDALHDALALIRERYQWKHLAEAVQGWPLSKVFRNIGVRAI